MRRVAKSPAPDPWRAVLLPVLLSGAAAFGLSRLPVLESVEHVAWDGLVRLRAELQPRNPSDALALIGIDEASLRDFGRWPWPRRLHGDFLLLAGLRRPSVTAWDLLFTEPSAEAEDDAHLARGVAGAGGTVVLGAMGADPGEGSVSDSPEMAGVRAGALTRVEGDRSRVLGAGAALLPAGELAKRAYIGFVDTPPDRDGTRRRVPLVVRIGEDVLPSLSLRALMAHWRAEPGDVTVRLGEAVEVRGRLGSARIPIDEAGCYRVNFRHGVEDLATYGYSQALAQLADRYERKPGRVPQLTGRIVLVGQTAAGLTDLAPTPLAAQTPLVLVHANALENFLGGDYLRRVSAAWVWLGLGLVGAVCVWRFAERELREHALVAAGVPVVFLLGATLAWIEGSVVVPLTGPLLGFGALQVFAISRRVLAEQRAKERIKGMFGTYLAPEVVERMVKAREMPRLGGSSEEITAYFSDIQGFSTFSEQLPPERLVELLNDYLSACTDVIQAEGGTLDKYIGDAVVAMFGAPVALPGHAHHACLAALRSQARLEELRRIWRDAGSWPEPVTAMQSRIGLNTGVAVVGNMGSRVRFNYTMMGDAVNLAARMESGAKHWGAAVMCTEATRTACEHQAPGRIVFRPLGRIVVKGRAEPVFFHEVLAEAGTLTPDAAGCVEAFTRGLSLFAARDWDGARRAFNGSAALEPRSPGRTPGVTTNPSLVHLELVERFRREPPPASWDGTHVMTEK